MTCNLCRPPCECGAEEAVRLTELERAPKTCPVPTCKHCGCTYSKRGLPLHERACPKRPAEAR
jgi:hypothetical protein